MQATPTDESPPSAGKLHLVAFGLFIVAFAGLVLLRVVASSASDAYNRLFNTLTDQRIIDDAYATQVRLRFWSRALLFYVLPILDSAALVLSIRARRRGGGRSTIVIAVICVVVGIAGVLFVMAARPSPPVQ